MNEHFPCCYVPHVEASGEFRYREIAIGIPHPGLRSRATDGRTGGNQELEPFEVVGIVVCGVVLDFLTGVFEFTQGGPRRGAHQRFGALPAIADC